MSNDLLIRLRGLADCDSRAGQPLGKTMRRAADEIERLRLLVKFWKASFEDEKRDHEATIKHTERQLDEFSA